jgi:hypothetical protein
MQQKQIVDLHHHIAWSSNQRLAAKSAAADEQLVGRRVASVDRTMQLRVPHGLAYLTSATIDERANLTSEPNLQACPGHSMSSRGILLLKEAVSSAGTRYSTRTAFAQPSSASRVSGK